MKTVVNSAFHIVCKHTEPAEIKSIWQGKKISKKIGGAAMVDVVLDIAAHLALVFCSHLIEEFCIMGLCGFDIGHETLHPWVEGIGGSHFFAAVLRIAPLTGDVDF